MSNIKSSKSNRTSWIQPILQYNKRTHLGNIQSQQRKRMNKIVFKTKQYQIASISGNLFW